jgi:predicted deacylase
MLAVILVAAALLGAPGGHALAFPIEGDEQFPALPSSDDSSEGASSAMGSTIGWSIEGRPIEVVRFGEGAAARLIVAGIHGGSEANTTALALELVEFLSSHPDAVPQGITLYVLPLLNPDGAARATGPEGRTNARGVDLNRNWPALWQPEWNRSGCWSLGPTSAGSRPASEPETMSLIQFISAVKVEALISYHSAALGIFAGGQPPEADSLRLAESLAGVSDYPYPPIDTGCTFTGQLIDWAADNRIAAVDIELHNHRDTDLDVNLMILRTFLDWEG